ncbi:lysozyme family protein [Bacillus sp. V5-8f]|uniref:lysozyme family protein n=1 Tax=Bacillus sp. V5-8f TaxID=2053044 RepID=UPI0035B53929
MFSLAPGAITDPEYSIQIVVKYFADVLKQAKGNIKLALQSYNFGNGFIGYAWERRGYTKELAIELNRMMAARSGWGRYGDVNYVEHVMRTMTVEPAAILM